MAPFSLIAVIEVCTKCHATIPTISDFRTLSSPEKETLYPLAVITNSCPLPPSSRQPLIFYLCLYNCLFWTFHINRFIQYLFFATGFFHLMFSRFILVVACISILLLFIAEYYSIVQICHISWGKTFSLSPLIMMLAVIFHRCPLLG